MTRTAIGLISRLAAMLIAAFLTLTPTISTAESVALRTSDAMKYFHAICGATLPDFANAPAALQRNGFQQHGTGTWFLPDQSVSIKILDGPGMGKSCSFVANSVDNEATIKAAVAESLPGMGRAVPNATLYPNSRALVEMRPEIGKFDGVSIFSLRMMSDRN